MNKKKEEISAVDDYFASLDVDPTLNTVPAEKAEIVRKDLQAVLKAPEKTQLVWDLPQNAQYPGGVDALRNDYLPMIEFSMRNAREQFGYERNFPLNILWEQEDSNGFAGAGTNYKMDFDVQVNNGKLSIKSLTTPCHTLKIYGRSSDMQNVFNHETGHIMFHNVLPHHHPLQEASACVTQAILDPSKGISYDGHLEPVVLMGEKGWGMPEFGYIECDADSSKISYAGFFHGFIKAAGDLQTAKSILMYSRTNWGKSELAEESTNMPSLDDWVKDVDCEFPDFQKKIIDGPYGRPIPEGTRLIWTPTLKWGGSLSLQHFQKNTGFFANIYDLDEMYGTLKTLTETYHILFPEYSIAVAATPENRNMPMDAATIGNMFSQLAQQKGIDKKLPQIGSQVIVYSDSSPDAEPVVLVWDDSANEEFLNQKLI